MRILVIEDEVKIAQFVKRGLKEEGYAVDVAGDGEEGHFMLSSNEYDAIVLDLMLPKIDGLTLCRTLRKEGNQTPIIMLTAKDTVKDKVKGLDSGADDYLPKPFAFEELLARVRVVLRKKDSRVQTQLKVDDLVMDILTHKVTRAEREIDLTVKEYALLEYLMRNAGNIVTRTMISEHVWDINFDTFTNVIDVYINYLRNKIDSGFENKMIHTVRGKGYLLKKVNMLLQSIRFKIVLWHMLILSLALFIFGMVLYQNLHRKISQDTDDILRSRAKGIEESIDTYWEAEQMDIAEGDVKVHFTKEDNINFIKIARRWVGEKISDPNLISIIVRIFDAHGYPIASSRNIPTEHLNSRIFYDVKKGADHFENADLNVNERPSLFRIFTTPVMENKRLSYVVQVASPLSQLNTVLSNLEFSLLFLLPLTVILTGFSGVFLVQLTLRPVDQMIETIHQITAENLKLRLEIPGTKDEIDSLANTFNQMIARLDEAFTTQRQFMEDISHELKTPLSVLKGELEVTLKRIRSTQEYETALHSSLEEVNRIAGIVENLLTLARFDAKTTTLHAQPLDLNLLIKDAVEAIQVLAIQKEIALQFNSAHSVEILADKNQLKRLILNILDNAIKYTPSGGSISIDLRQQKNSADIDITDTGIGIPEDELPHIFDRFYRVDKSRSSVGFGLGLSIAQSIAMAHGGNIYAQANLPQGTIFTITLPIKFK